jgi:hypothetical protein
MVKSARLQNKTAKLKQYHTTQIQKERNYYNAQGKTQSRSDSTPNKRTHKTCSLILGFIESSSIFDHLLEKHHAAQPKCGLYKT